MSSIDHLLRLSRLVATLRDELESCDQALLSYERGVLGSTELYASLNANSPMSLDAVHTARYLINDLLLELGSGTN